MLQKKNMEREIPYIMLVGNSGVGKTTLTKRILGQELERRWLPTLGSDCHTITLDKLDYILWEKSGQEKFSPDGYCNNARAAIIMVSADSRGTLRSAAFWNSKLPRGIPRLLCVNKIDIISISDSEIADMAAEIGADVARISVKKGEYQYVLEWIKNNVN